MIRRSNGCSACGSRNRTANISRRNKPLTPQNFKTVKMICDNCTSLRSFIVKLERNKIYISDTLAKTLYEKYKRGY